MNASCVLSDSVNIEYLDSRWHPLMGVIRNEYRSHANAASVCQYESENGGAQVGRWGQARGRTEGIERNGSDRPF